MYHFRQDPVEPPFDIYFHSERTFSFRGRAENKNRKVISDLSATATWSARAKRLKMFEGAASVALLVVNKLPALQALALDYATEEEEPSPACVRS